MSATLTAFFFVDFELFFAVAIPVSFFGLNRSIPDGSRGCDGTRRRLYLLKIGWENYPPPGSPRRLARRAAGRPGLNRASGLDRPRFPERIRAA